MTRTWQIGDIVRLDTTSIGKNWFVVSCLDRTEIYDAGEPRGWCFKGLCSEDNHQLESLKDGDLFAWNFISEDCEHVPDDEVPDDIWAALAMWRLGVSDV